MSDRRRSLFILLLVIGLIAGSAAVISTKETKLGLDLQGGVQLIYEGQPTPQQPTVTQEALDRALQIMRERVDAFGVAEPELQLLGEEQIEVNLPGVEDAERAADQVGSTAQLFFYDWEANILDEDCRTNDDQVAGPGGQQSVTGLYQAVERASKCEAQVDRNNQAAAEPRFYVFDEISKRPFGRSVQTYESEEAALDDLEPEQRERAEVVEVPAGILVVREQKSDAPNAPDPDAWWVIQDNPALSGTDLKNPEQNFDQRLGNEPIVTFDFTDRGREAFSRITSRIAQRGADNALPGPPADATSQHFAIVLDHDLASAPVINHTANPDGVD